MVYALGTDLTALNRQFFRWSGGTPTVTDMGTLAGHCNAGWASFMAALTPDTTTLEHTTATDLSSDTGAQATEVSSTAGTRGSPELGAGTAACVSMTLGRRYRGGKPRTYWPFGIQTDLLTPQTWASAFVTAVTNAAQDFAAYIAAGASGATALGPQVNVSYFSGFVVITSPITGRATNTPVRRVTPLVNNITGWACNPNLGSQRRRNQIR